jgi:kinesin family protein 2/24
MVGDDDEAELRRVVQSLFEQEENLLNFHMSTKIQENAELLTEEGKMLQNVQREGATQDDYDEYAARLGCILERKTMLIAMLEDRMASFRAQLKKEEELSKRVGNLSQY